MLTHNNSAVAFVWAGDQQLKELRKFLDRGLNVMPPETVPVWLNELSEQTDQALHAVDPKYTPVPARAARRA